MKNLQTAVENRLIYSEIADNAALGTSVSFLPMFDPRSMKTGGFMSKTTQANVKTDFACQADVKAGSLLWPDAGFTCMSPAVCVLVAEDRNGLYVPCDEGRHYLDGQLDNGRYVGLRPFSAKRAR